MHEMFSFSSKHSTKLLDLCHLSVDGWKAPTVGGTLRYRRTTTAKHQIVVTVNVIGACHHPIIGSRLSRGFAWRKLREESSEYQAPFGWLSFSLAHVSCPVSCLTSPNFDKVDGIGSILIATQGPMLPMYTLMHLPAGVMLYHSVPCLTCMS